MGADRNAAFWKWFKKNQIAYWELDTRFLLARTRLFDNLLAQLKKIDSNLVFEFGEVIDGKRELVISADGMLEAFPAVTALVMAAPSLPRWKIIAFRPRYAQAFSMKFRDRQFDPEKIFVQLESDDGLASLDVFMPGYSGESHDIHVQGLYILLDTILGEYDVVTKVRTISLFPAELAPATATALAGLAEPF